MTQTATLTLSEFLLARIAEDEASLPGGPDLSGYVEGFSPADFARWEAESAAWERRWAAECAAKRRIVEDHEYDETPGSPVQWARVLRLLALPYGDHPDFRQEWRV